MTVCEGLTRRMHKYLCAFVAYIVFYFRWIAFNFTFVSFLDEQFLVDSTHLTMELDSATQKTLVDQVRQQLGTEAGGAYTKSMGRINWSKIKIDGLTAAKAKVEFEKIIKPVRKVRTLTEVLDELERNPMRYAQDLPKQPPSAMFMYINENREKFMQKNNMSSVVN